MSYILDALKKSQAEQNPDSLGLNLTPPPTPVQRSLWPVIVTVALCANLLFFGWYFLSASDDNAQTVQANPSPTQSQGGAQTMAIDQVAPVQNRPQDSQPRTRNPVQPAATGRAAPITRNPTQRRPASPTTQPVTAPVPVRSPQPTRSIPVQRIPLAELSQAEQTLYAGFSYTSHIFTEDADLRAVVIDGQRLQAGDAFKGLKIVEITETGVVFSESRRGKTRHVMVSSFE